MSCCGKSYHVGEKLLVSLAVMNSHFSEYLPALVQLVISPIGMYQRLESHYICLKPLFLHLPQNTLCLIWLPHLCITQQQVIIPMLTWHKVILFYGLIIKLFHHFQVLLLCKV